MSEVPELVDELKQLRKGRGVCASRIVERVGPRLRDVCQVHATDGPAQVRHKVATTLEALAGRLPSDLELAVQAAFGIVQQVRLPLYQDRVAWIAAQINRDARTARRRIDDGIQQLAQLAADGFPAEGRQSPIPARGWRTVSLSTSLILDRPEPIMIEERRVMSGQDDLDELDLSMTCAAVELTGDSPRLASEVLYGGTVVRSVKESSSRTSVALALPHPLGRGDHHDFALMHRIGDPTLLRPHLACVPRRPCDRFDLRVRFGARRAPSQVWILDNALQRDLDDQPSVGRSVTPDSAGEIRLTFHDLHPGMAYGARWVP